MVTVPTSAQKRKTLGRKQSIKIIERDPTLIIEKSPPRYRSRDRDESEFY